MSYSPSPKNSAAFPQLAALAQSGTRLEHNFRRVPETLRVLPGGQLFFDSRLELDTDGWPGGSGKGDRHYQTQTSYTLADRTPIDANAVPYFVLPQPVSWPKSFGIWLGDVAAVFYEGKLSFAVFADFGGTDTIGEGSIQLLRELGMERLKEGRIVNRGTPPGVVTVVFPGSRPALRCRSMAELIDETRRRGREHLDALFGAPAAALAPASDGLASRIVDIAQSELEAFGGCAEDVEPLNGQIGRYWQALGLSYDGRDSEQYWSAAFVSHVVREASAEAAFEYSKRHSEYVHRAIRDREEGRPGRFWAYRPAEISIARGDILAMNQTTTRAIDFEEARHSSRYASHSDIVVDVQNGRVETIGGNVGAPPGTVGKKTFAWRGGVLRRVDQPKQQVFAVLRPPPIA